MDSKIMNVLKEHDLELGPVPATGPYRHFRLTRDADGVAWLLIDVAEASANILSSEVLEEFSTIITVLESERPAGLVLRSAKRSGFVAGADVKEFRGLNDISVVESQLSRGHDILNRLENLKFPTVAVIHGFCLGGGLEVVLACKKRIAIDGARFGFPEVLLGLHPGFGGTARSVYLFNPVEAMTMMLTGKTVESRKAKGLGLVDAVTQERHVLGAVKDAISGKLKSKRSPLVTIMNLGPARRMLASRMRSETRKKASPENYPAPFALIDLWEKHGGSRAGMLKAEIPFFSKLMVGATAQNLIRVFFLRDDMKKLAGGRSPVKHVHVIGAGAMGGDIASWCAHQGLRVTLADMQPSAIAGAMKRAADLFSKINRSRIGQRDALDRLIPDMVGEGARHADLVIEAVPEKLELKQKIYAGLEDVMKPGAILATNTSSIPLEELRTTLKSPSRLVGVHFFNPVSRLQLVEVVTHDQIDPEVLATAKKFVGGIDRLPLQVKSAPGFLVNRALMPYLMEALLMLDEKTDKLTIDEAAEKFGMPMGPIELADQVGLDICLAVGDELRAKLGDVVPAAPEWLREKVARGELGRKTGRGFYEWKDGRVQKGEAQVHATDEMIDRLVLPMSNVCMSCLREGIVDNADHIDGAMIFATGYAPFRGGPLNYARERGPEKVANALSALAAKFGERFKPDEGWASFR